MRKLFLLLIIGVGLFSCDNSDDQSQESSGPILPKVERFVSGGSEEMSHASYIYDGGGLLNSIVSNNDEDIITYEYNTEHLISKIGRGNGDNLQWQTRYEYSSQKKLIKETYESYGNTNVTNYSYMADGSIQWQSLVNGEITNNGIIKLNQNGEIIELKRFDLDGTLVYTQEITYDDKNSLYRNIPGMDKLINGAPTQSGFYGRVNNILEIKHTYHHPDTTSSEYFSSLTYTYNKDNFPVTRSEVINGYSSEGFIHFTYR